MTKRWDAESVTRWSSHQAAVIRHLRTRAFLLQQGLPRRSLLFEAAEPTGRTQILSGQVCVLLGSYDKGEQFFLDVERGQVLFGAEGFDDAHSVNTTVEMFAQCLLVSERAYPYYSSAEGPSAFVSVAGRLEALFAAVDPATYGLVGSFWKTFVHDVSVGDFAIEDVDWWSP
ncbi:SUKH-4 family immunity protein [Micromonospora sp. NPDC051006]|uniref:SUKH-4 family immunity protein n=1 Tax=Micromonospora sp. NPDC051006 TaxID=3364283 RepID=UPI0037970D34